MFGQKFIVFVLAISSAVAKPDRDYHNDAKRNVETRNIENLNLDELPGSYWLNNAQNSLRSKVARPLNRNIAKNIIMFLGDGMSVATLAPARTYLGQKDGRTGEESQLSFETFPSVGLSKTYCVDGQIADSACTATAYLCGVKNNKGTIGYSAEVPRWDCPASTNDEYKLESLAAWSINAGKDAGIVTTTRITHASPAGAYARVAQRGWESNNEVEADNFNTSVCPDIAHQLIHEFPGNRFKVIFGGGRRKLIGYDVMDEEGEYGERTDGRNLTDEWVNNRISEGVSHAYIWNRDQLMNVDYENTDYILGLFESNHLRYNLLTDPVTEPTLEELTESAIKILSKSNEGYFLFVEGGRIDHAHHDTQAQLAVDETVEFSKAVQKAVDLTNQDDTLIVVTSDHSHSFAFNGYSIRGKDILGPSDDLGRDGVPYMTLSYTNGPGFQPHASVGVRTNPLARDYSDPEYMYPAEVDLSSETHAGEDVAVFALGPHDHLFTGLYEQSEIPHFMAYAACVGPGLQACSSAANLISKIWIFILGFVVLLEL